MAETPDPESGSLDFLEKIRLHQSRYADFSSVRALVQLIPHLGSSIDTLLAGNATGIRLRRLELFLEDLRQEMETLTSTRIDREFIESEEFQDLLVLAIEKATRTRERQKIRDFARILANACLPDWSFQMDTVKELLETVSDLTTNELLVMRAMWDEARQRPRDEIAKVFGASQPFLEIGALSPFLPHLSHGEILGYVARLQRTGIVVADTQGYFDSAGGNFTITPLFDRVMRILTRPAKTVSDQEDKVDGS